MTEKKEDKYDDKAALFIAYHLCLLENIAPIDQIDGSSNYWMFYNDAKKLVDSLRERNFTFPVAEKIDFRVPSKDK